MVRWTFDISVAGGKGGTWYFWGRVLNPNNRSDFMLVEGHPGDPKIPGPPYPGGDSAPVFNNDDDRIFEQTATAWDWWGDEEGSDKVLQGSENTMYIYHRQGNATVFWDVFMWTDNPDYVPTDEDYQNALIFVPGPASNPSPANGAKIVDTSVSLIWTPGPSAVSHDVYFGDNFNHVYAGTRGTSRGNQTSNHFLVGLPGHPYPDGLVYGTTYYWRIDEVETDGVTKHRGRVWSFFIPSRKAYNPVPPDGAKSVVAGVTLTWAAGLGAESHTVYFGDDPETVANAVGGTPQMQNQYYPGALEFDKTYYWRVDEFDVDGAATYKGDIWSFTIELADALEPSTVSTFHCISVYWSPQGSSPDKDVLIDYRPKGTSEWLQALPMRYNPISITGEDKAYYRGSIVNLTPETEYEIRLTFEGDTRVLEARTWSEDFPIGATEMVGNRSRQQYFTISGTADAYHLYDGTDSTINVNNNSDYCIFINASYVIIRGFNLQGARQHGIYIEGGHDIIIEDCDISNWGDSADGIFGRNVRSGIFSPNPELKRVVIQRCKIHHPRYDTNSWAEDNNGYHPKGPQCIALLDSEGNNVIRYNQCWSDAEHYYNDPIGYGHNASYRGFPGPDSDIYCNYVADCWDDGIEAEGGGQNVRIWNNYTERCLMAIGNAPISIGPTYIWRNVCGESYCLKNEYGNFLKMGYAVGLEWMTGHMYVFHNTILQPDGKGFSGLGCARSQSGIARYIYHCTTRNNILHVRERDAVSISYQGGDNDFDYDLHSRNVPEGHESHGIKGIPTYVSGAGFDFVTMTGNFQLDESSAGYDAGELIPNFSDGYTGVAPDVGAHENDWDDMAFGVNAVFVPPNGEILIIEEPKAEGFETGDFSALNWTSYGDADWAVTSSQKNSGAYSAQAGFIEDDQTSTLAVTLDCASGEISFYRKVSSEASFDYLRFYIDGEEQDRWSGEEDWTDASFPVTEGRRTFRWEYSKDGSASDGDDTAWIDDIVFPAN
ncbi:MAG: right-handed parallel beta-helix repeat-containing protein [Planctomycetota bacterium]